MPTQQQITDVLCEELERHQIEIIRGVRREPDSTWPAGFVTADGDIKVSIKDSTATLAWKVEFGFGGDYHVAPEEQSFDLADPDSISQIIDKIKGLQGKPRRLL